MGSIETDKKKALGKGLASLIPHLGGSDSNLVKKEFFLCDIEKIVPNTFQPRKIFDKDALEELTESIRVAGIVQPLTVRRKEGHFELIAGERRWRAAQRAGLKQVPVVVRDAEDGQSLEMALIENIQRENLNCIEEAIAFQQLTDEFQLSQEEIAQRVGKNRATISNTMRLLKLPAVVREDLTSDRLTMGHARALLSLEIAEDQLAIRETILKKKLSVRDTERKVNELLRQRTTGVEMSKEPDVHIKALEEDLRRQYGTAVRIFGGSERGFIQFTYTSRDDLMRLADRLKGQNVLEENRPV